MIFVAFLIDFFLILCLILLLGQADQIREERTQSTHTEHAQSTRRALERQPNRKEPKWLCEVYGNSQKDFEDSHKD